MGPKSTTCTGLIRRVCAFAGMLLGVGMLAPATVLAQESRTTTIETVVVEPLGLTLINDLDFGDIVPSTGGTVNMVPTTTPTCTETGAVLHTNECQPAAYAGSGSHNQRVRIRVPQGAEIEIENPAGDTMLITDVTLDAHPDLNLVRQSTRTWHFRIADTSGYFEFRLGGVLNVASGQPPGTYTGEFDVDIQYF